MLGAFVALSLLMATGLIAAGFLPLRLRVVQAGGFAMTVGVWSWLPLLLLWAWLNKRSRRA